MESQKKFRTYNIPFVVLEKETDYEVGYHFANISMIHANGLSDRLWFVRLGSGSFQQTALRGQLSVSFSVICGDFLTPPVSAV